MKEYSRKADFAMLVGPVTDERPARRIFSFLVIVPAIFTVNISSHFFAIIILSSFFAIIIGSSFLLSLSCQDCAANLTLATTKTFTSTTRRTPTITSTSTSRRFTTTAI